MKNMWIVGNWKSNKNTEETLNWLNQFGELLPKELNCKVVVCPQYPQLETLYSEIKKNDLSIYLGSQDISPFPKGSYTGEVSAESLKNIIYLSIIGHSERRSNFSETDELINKKVQQALESNIIPLVCVQSENTPVPIGCKHVAYEPVFAIGTNNPDTPENANKVAKILKERNGSDLEVLYGGSVNKDNFQPYINQEFLSGLLIGRASLDAQEFGLITQGCSNLHI